jgi:hypothetical protein
MFVSALASLLVLSSCVFKNPFEASAGFPVDQDLLGRWESTSDGDKERMLVLQHSANEFTVQYPVGEDALFFRAYWVELEGGRYIQAQLIGSAKGPVKAEERKFHLLKIKQSGDTLEMRTIDPEVLGAKEGDTAALRAAFAKHHDDPKLFQDPGTFKRIK